MECTLDCMSPSLLPDPGDETVEVATIIKITVKEFLDLFPVKFHLRHPALITQRKFSPTETTNMIHRAIRLYAKSVLGFVIRARRFMSRIKMLGKWMRKWPSQPKSKYSKGKVF